MEHPLTRLILSLSMAEKKKLTIIVSQILKQQQHIISTLTIVPNFKSNYHFRSFLVKVYSHISNIGPSPQDQKIFLPLIIIDSLQSSDEIHDGVMFPNQDYSTDAYANTTYLDATHFSVEWYHKSLLNKLG